MRPSLSFLLLSSLLLVPPPQPAGAQEGYTLEDLLRMGRERNPSLQAVRADAAAMAAQRRAEGRLPNPELEYETGRGDPFDGGDSRSVEGFSVRQVVENPLVRRHRLGALDARVEAAEEEVRSGALEVEYEIRMHVSRILYLQERVELARLNAEALEETRTLVEARARVGEVKELEAIRLRVEHLRARNEADATALELDQFRRHLNTFLGNVLPDGYAVLGELRADEPEPELEELVRRVLPDHPALRRAALEEEAARREMQASQLAWLPDPVLAGHSEKGLDGDIRRLGIGLEIPLWNQSRAATRESRERMLGASARAEALRLEVEAQLMIHLNHLTLNRRALQLFQEGLLEEAEASMGIAETSYREGEISLVEYLDARRTYQSIRIEHFQALYDWNVERAELERAAGGGVL